MMQALQYEIERAERDFAYAKRRLVEQAESIADRMLRVSQNVEKGFSVNSLGELQGSGPDFDRLCALFCEKADDVERLKYLAERIEKEEEAA